MQLVDASSGAHLWAETFNRDLEKVEIFEVFLLPDLRIPAGRFLSFLLIFDDRLYRATPIGRKALKAAKAKVRELVGELFEDEK